MAWIDDRLWCHPKVADLSDAAYRAFVNGIAYSSGLSTRGFLTAGQRRTIGCGRRAYTELIDAGLWLEQADGSVAIKDWDEHNGKRDARKQKDRDRKKAAYWSEKPHPSNGVSTGEPVENTAEECGESRALTVVKEVTSEENPDGFSQIVRTWLDLAPPLMRHRHDLTRDDKAKRAAAKAVNVYGLDDVCESVRLYANVLGSSTHYFKHKWTLVDFLNRGVAKFVPEAEPLENFETRTVPMRRDTGMSFEQILGMNGGEQDGPRALPSRGVA